jgi:hypothetical protein
VGEIDECEEREMSETKLLPPPNWGDDVVTIGEDGEYIVGLGHREPAAMVRACNALVGEEDGSPDAFMERWVTHEHARLREDPHHDWVIEWATEDGAPIQASDAGAFPVTVMEDAR